MKYWTARYTDRGDVTFKSDDDESKAAALKHAKQLGTFALLREATPGEIDNLNDKLQRHTTALRYY